MRWQAGGRFKIAETATESTAGIVFPRTLDEAVVETLEVMVRVRGAIPEETSVEASEEPEVAEEEAEDRMLAAEARMERQTR